jgi:hypothetical protein
LKVCWSGCKQEVVGRTFVTVRRLLTAVVLAVAVGLTTHVLSRAADVRQADQRVNPEENESIRLTAFGRCGVERWPVKTLTDPAARTVNLVARPATVAGMNALPAPKLPSNNTTRLPSERQAYRITATLVKYKLEADQDVHIVLAGGGKTMIAEMPSVNCDAGARARYAMLVARRRLETRYGRASDRWTYVYQRATATGMRFFDFNHGQSGIADNAVELHPVFGFKP